MVIPVDSPYWPAQDVHTAHRRSMDLERGLRKAILLLKSAQLAFMLHHDQHASKAAGDEIEDLEKILKGDQ